MSLYDTSAQTEGFRDTDTNIQKDDSVPNALPARADPAKWVPHLTSLGTYDAGRPTDSLPLSLRSLLGSTYILTEPDFLKDIFLKRPNVILKIFFSHSNCFTVQLLNVF